MFKTNSAKQKEPALQSRPVLTYVAKAERTDVSAALRFSCYHADHTMEEFPEIGTIAGKTGVALVSDAVGTPIDLCARLSQNHPVVLISSEQDFKFRLAAARAGVKTILPRPFNAIDLAKAVEENDPFAPEDRLSVVLIDDDQLMADVQAQVLMAAGIDVKVITDPARAVAAIERLHPDLVLMDLRMPEVDGIELARIIRLSRDLASIPIVYLSRECNGDIQTAARRVGGDDFIQKPISPQKLIDLVKLRGDRSKILRFLGERDSLTGLLHHKSFREKVQQAVREGSNEGRNHSLAMIDVDRFKSINDTYGHLVGDQVLRTLAQLLSSALRRSDVVGRCGGEEFGVLLCDTDLDAACETLERVRSLFAITEFKDQTVDFRVTFSAGVAARYAPGDGRLAVLG